jgi:hypothetical protein
MSHAVQDGLDAAVRARTTSGSRRRPVRYNVDTWLAMRNDPVLPAAVILRLRNPDGSESFVAVRWDLDPEGRRLIGRFATLDDADRAVPYEVIHAVVAAAAEDAKALRARQERQAVELERRQLERERLYGP